MLHAFSGYSSDGARPYAPVVRDKADNLYGTTAEGGTDGDCLGDAVGCGTIFKIDTAGNGTVLYNFPRSPDGCFPFQGMSLDKSGNLYGTASWCGTEESYGTIFELQGAKNFKLLYDFSGLDGDTPEYGNLIMDKSRNFYGVTTLGGVDGTGVVYKVSPRRVESVLYDFSGAPTDGCYPHGTLVQDESGNLYGTTSDCGPHNLGTIWKLNKKGNETLLHKFAGGGKDGCNPLAGMVRDAKGNLYGVTYGCGAHNAGVLYELSAKGKFTLLHSFTGADGSAPIGELLLTANGALFGTTYEGGSHNAGTVWEYAP